MLTSSTRLLFAICTFLGAALVFLVQPMAARELLPVFGGTPNVWNTAVVSFQVLLLAGYAFAHVTLHLLGPRRQAIAQLGLGAIALAFVPFTLDAGRDLTASLPPAASVALLLTVAVGVPYLAVASASPVMQRWYAALGEPDSANPYFLYTASNAGSLVGLLAFPFLLEPTQTTAVQLRTWAIAFGAWLLLLAACAALVRRHGIDAVAAAHLSHPTKGDEQPAPARIGVWRALRWVLVAAVPSAAMLGVTTFLTTDVASAPLLWVVPLALYLISFMVTFGRRVRIGVRVAGALMAALMIPLLLVELDLIDVDTLPHTLLHLGAMLATAILGHAWLYADRPPARQLTTFYLLLSVGGALGGAFIALVAPVAFDRVLEYPLLLALLLVLRPVIWPGPKRWDEQGWWRALAAIVELTSAGVVVGLLASVAIGEDATFELTRTELIVACVWMVLLALRRWGFVLAIAVLLALVTMGTDQQVLHAERNFFGTLRVEATGEEHRLLHGTTLHGTQLQAMGRRGEPTTYYGHAGPVGDVFTQLQRDEPFAQVGVVGLGTGSLLAHGQLFQRFTYFEIDPAVIRVAQDPELFSYVADTDANVDIVEGDARLKLREQPDERFDLLVLDAYSSDAVPVHLLTVEAFELYRDKLAPGGVIALHISSRHLDLEPVVAANVARLGMASAGRNDDAESLDVATEHLTGSHWLALARSEDALRPLMDAAGWEPLVDAPEQAAWTDDFSNVAATITWLPNWLRPGA